MSTRKTTVFSGVLIAVTFFVVGLVLASRMDLTPQSTAQTVTVPQTNSAPITGPIDAQTFRNIAKAASPWVVNIRTESRQRATDLTEFFGGDDLFRRFFGEPGQEERPNRRSRPRDQIAQAAGTGFIIDKQGFILTNNHVVEGATLIKVSLYGEDTDQEYEAKVVGRDPLTDSALIQLTEKPDHTLPEAKFGDSNQVAPGDWVMAIGNPFGLNHTVSVGVVSASGRPFQVAPQRSQDVIQTDAAINPGNSGGPLLNARGEVVGINTAIYSNERGNIGIGFAIPINAVRDLLPQLRTGKITRGMIGVQVAAVTRDVMEQAGLKDRKGALVSTVTPDGPADKGGMEPGDVIVEFSGKPVPNRDALVEMVKATKPGTAVPVKVLRDGKERMLTINIGELDLEAESGMRSPHTRDPQEPEEQAASSFGLSLGNLTPEIARRLRIPDRREGVLVTDVDPAGPAGRAGIQPRDVILQINRRPVATAAEAADALKAVQSGRTASFLIWRGTSEIFVIVRKE